MNQATDFTEVFSRLAREGRSEETTRLGGVNVRLVRVPGGGEGRWDRHDRTTETVVVWSGDFTVEFLGAARLMAVAARHGATVRVHPVDFGTIFPASGGLPVPKRSPLRQAYRLQELERWRRFLAVPIQLRPRFYPINERPAAHCVIAVRETVGDAPAIALAHRVLKALWEEEADTGDRGTLATLIGDVGLDAPSVLRQADEERWAARRAADTTAALDRGVFGAPSYVIGEEIFWGQDRLEFLDRRLGRG